MTEAKAAAGQSEQEQQLEQFIKHTIDQHLPARLHVLQDNSRTPTVLFETLQTAIPKFANRKHLGHASSWIGKTEEIFAFSEENLGVSVTDRMKIVAASLKFDTAAER